MMERTMRTGLRTASSGSARLFQPHSQPRCTKANMIWVKNCTALHFGSQVRLVSHLSHTERIINKGLHRYKPTVILNQTFQHRHLAISSSFSTTSRKKVQSHTMDLTTNDMATTKEITVYAAQLPPNESTTAAAKQNPEPKASDPAWDSDSDSSSSEEESLIETWGNLVQTVTTTTKKAFLKSPTFDLTTPSGRTAFQSHWRKVFSTLEESITSDDSLPHYLTSPPVNKFNITLFTETHQLHCPCCLPEVDPSIVLENETGVTKVDFIQGLAGYLYGSDDKLPFIYSYGKVERYRGYRVRYDDEGVEVEEGEGGLVPGVEGEEEEDCDYRLPASVYMADWMSAGTEKGQPVVYMYGREYPLIWLYCCRGDELGDKMREREDLEDVEGEKGKEQVEEQNGEGAVDNVASSKL